MKKITMKSHVYSWMQVARLALCILVIGLSVKGAAQTPVVTVRFNNPTYDCATGQYCLDVEFLSDIDSIEVFGMNVRFFYDDMIMELDSFTDFQGGYAPVSPDPPAVTQSAPGIGYNLFRFGAPGTGVADFVNGAIQLVDQMQPSIYLDDVVWTKLFKICFSLDNPGDSASFCPPVVWDLEADPANGGFLTGDDGVVITYVDPDPNIESSPTTENVVQFNWEYIGPGTPPYGQPIEEVCISLECIPTIVCPADVTIECIDSTDPLSTGTAIADTVCFADVTVSFQDTLIPGVCTHNYVIERTWIAINSCNISDSCIQLITIIDTTAPVIVTCPSDITIQCDASTSPDALGQASATDICDPLVEIQFNDTIISGACPQEFTIERTWIATDDCDNSSTCLQVITVVDTLPPSITCPTNMTIECTESTLPGNTGSAVATDICDPNPTITFADNILPGACPQEFTINRTWTATDACGNTNTCLQVILVDDSTPPAITCPANTTIECTASTLPGNTGTATASDLCDATPIVTYGDIITPGTCPQEYTISRTWEAADDCGNTSTCIQIIVIQDTAPPSISCPVNTTIECTASTLPINTGSATATDLCDPSPVITFSDSNSPGACPQEYTITRTWRATDACGNSATCVQTIIVDDSQAPSITCPPNTTIECTASTLPLNTGTATASDLCDPSPAVTFSDAIVPGSCPQERTITRTWRATDDCGNSATCVQTIFVDDSTPPSIVCPSNLTIECTANTQPPATGVATASDNCDLAPAITFADATVAGGCPQEYTINRTWTATDDCGNTSTCLQVIIVDDSTPPSITCPAGITVSCASQVPPVNTGSVTSSDNCTPVPTITHVGDVITNQTCADRFTLTRTYRATDACGNSSTCAQIIIVNDQTPPSVTCPANVTVSCASQVPAVNTSSVITSDNCGGAVTVTHIGDVVTNQTCANRFTVTRTYQASDACGNSATCSQIITVNDITPPAITCPPNITVDFGDPTDPQSTGIATGTDNCGGVPVITSSDITIAGLCDEEFTINRTWTATDACGNSTTCLQVVFVDGVCNIDLALVKDLAPGEGPIYPGDDISFVITVTNEGETDVSSVTIIDYIPTGFVLNDPDWTPGMAGSTGQSATIVLSIANGGLDPGGLNPGESVTVNITLQALPDAAPGIYENIAEILTVFDLDGNDVTDLDLDSFSDDDDTNDPDAEDDHDPAAICVLFDPVILGDGYVCPEEIVTYSVENGDPSFTYNWTLSGGGTIIANNGPSVDIQWQAQGGGPFQLSVQVVIGQGCTVTAFFTVYVQGVESIACNDLIQISLDTNCQAVILSGMILEGENEGNNNYFVVITDQNGNVIPNATLTAEHIGGTFMVSVQNECNNQSCWGTIIVEDKIPPTIECTDAVVPCGTPLAPVYSQPITYSVTSTVNSGLSIGPDANVVTSQPIEIDLPSNATLTDINVTVDLNHTWSGDLLVELISPNGTSVTLANAVCGSADDWDNVTFDDQALTPVAVACNVAPPPALLQGFVIPEEALAAFNGEFADGTWILQITDLVGGDGGVLNYVTLDIDYFEAFAYAPVASDACGEVELTYTETETGETCETITITRIWTATDNSGNTATCVQTITVLPLDLDDIVFPGNYEGVCGESVSPDFTGWPTLNGQPVTVENELCNIFVGYWDKELVECGGGRKIVRTWTVLDWCTTELLEGQQIIKLADMQGPELTCPADFEVGTDFWYCHANVSVPKPIAYDACSDIASYSLASSSGTIVSFGNNYVINGLELGTHTVIWTVTDECGNSSTCSFEITVVDNVVPVANCDQHTIVSLTNDGPYGVTLVPASVFDDGSYDNCGPVTFRARRMDSCIEFDWTTEGACIDDIPGGIPPVNSRDRGTIHRPCVPFACCDVGAGPVMVELEVTDVHGNVNYCMIEATVQDKVSPYIQCPPDIVVSCDFWFHVEEGTFEDITGNNNGNVDEDPLTPVFGNMYDAFRYDENVRENIIIYDPANDHYSQPHNWGLDGWADDNCEVNLSVRVRVYDDCSGESLPGNPPPGAVKLIERRFTAADGNDGAAPATCTQRIWVVDVNPYYIADQNCFNADPQDGVIWPCDVLLTTCPDDLSGTGEPTIIGDACNLIGVTYEDTRFDFVDGSCFKILREWSVIDWCQYNPQTGSGLWQYTQVIKVHDEEGPAFQECPTGPVTLCVADTGVTLPDNNQAFLGEENPLASSCSVHLNINQPVHETCSDLVSYDVKIYPFNGNEYIQVQGTKTATVDENNIAILNLDTRQSPIQSVRLNGLPYNSPWCGDYHRILWSVEDGCGNWSHCEYLLRLEDCKQPSPVCINGLSTVVMPVGGQVTIWAKDFDASSFDDCTPAEELLYSFSGDAYQPSFTYTCDNVPAFSVELSTNIWVADGGTDDNCNGVIEWSERNKDYCTTTIVITDNAGICGDTSGSILAGDILTDQALPVEKVNVLLTSPGHYFPTYVTSSNGHYSFHGLPLGVDYTVRPERLDDPRNGVSTLDLVKIQKHLLGTELFNSPCQYIAADANNNGQVSAIDMVEIRKLILGIYQEYPNNTSWRFVNKGVTMDPVNPWPLTEEIDIPALAADSMMDNHFVAVKVGDINHSVKANAQQILPRNGQQVLTVTAEAPEMVDAGEVVEVHFTLSDIVNGFQWTLETEGLEFESVGSDVLAIGDQHIGLPGQDRVTMSWNTSAVTPGVEGAAASIVMRWIATTPGRTADKIRLTGSITAAEAYDVHDELMDVKLSWRGAEASSEFALFQNEPNPWNGETMIGFTLPSEHTATLTVFDATGKEVLRREGQFQAGYNTLRITQKDLPQTGVLYYRLDSGEYSATKKMVLIQ